MSDHAYFMGLRLRRERLIAGKSQENLAIALGADLRTIERYERGEEPVTPSHLRTICLVLGVPLSWFAFQIEAELRASDASEGDAMRFEVARPLQVLSSVRYADVQGLLCAWAENRGVMTRGLVDEIVSDRLVDRAILLRRPCGSSYFRFEYVCPKMPLARPCELLSLVGREPDAMPDRDYGEWMATVFSRVAAGDRPHVAAILAYVKKPSLTTQLTCVQHDRVVLPWTCRSGDTYVIGASLLRRRTVITWARPSVNATRTLDGDT
jgi:transcriptional regulator with XRE-family HTH domain